MSDIILYCATRQRLSGFSVAIIILCTICRPDNLEIQTSTPVQLIYIVPSSYEHKYFIISTILSFFFFLMTCTFKILFFKRSYKLFHIPFGGEGLRSIIKTPLICATLMLGVSVLYELIQIRFWMMLQISIIYTLHHLDRMLYKQ